MTLLKGLPKRPPDLEACRVFLLIPEISRLVQQDKRNNFVTEFGRLLLEMEQDALRILCNFILFLFSFRKYLYGFKFLNMYVAFPD